MRVCIVAEGCYPFVVGGVSSWVHSLIQLFPETEFVILAIAANRSQRGKYAYELPKNVSAVYELYLDDVDWSGSKKLHRKRLKKEQYQALRSLILDQDIEWDVLFDLFQKENVSLNALLMGEDFLNAVRDCYNLKYSQIVFSDFLWTMRSIYLPLFLTMQTEIPRADLYHCVATANDKDQISAPLMSRFAVIEIPDYTPEEKKIIFSRYALPKVLKRIGMKEKECILTPEGLDAVISCHENTSGIRDLEQAAEHIAANALYQIEVNHVSSVAFDAEMVRELLLSC